MLGRQQGAARYRARMKLLTLGVIPMAAVGLVVGAATDGAAGLLPFGVAGALLGLLMAVIAMLLVRRSKRRPRTRRGS